ncbi:hypothetical protein B0H14DRAFT_3477559 [Mycena olivaceomarginata]|nr:hypothetical protein B0H14DRAFT_3477559 [Mycena olivaceomarginata]
MAASIDRFQLRLKSNPSSKILRLSDGGTLGLDFAPVDTTDLDDTQIIVLVPGPTGGKLIRPTTI